jgi:branched-chain amino acid transport system ATP-binding protein
MSQVEHTEIMRGNAGPPKLRVQDIHISFGGLRALHGVSVDVHEGEIVAVIGPNGAGKTTLLNAISGVYHPAQGRILFDGQDRTFLRPSRVATLGIARTFQNVALFRGMSVLDNIMVGRHCHMRASVLSAGLFWGLAQREEIRHRAAVERIIDFLEINHVRKAPAGTLPYGLQKRVELGRALAAEPKLILLDEPMAGMNLEEKEDMARFILDVNDEWGTTMMLIEHDMGVVMDISHRVVVLDHGETIAEGTPEHVRTDPVVVRAYLGEDAEGQRGGYA